MAQNAATVTNPNPTPPTNLSFTGSTLPNPLNFDPTVYGPPLNPANAPYYDDGVTPQNVSWNEPSGTRTVFAANHAALPVSGTSVAAEGAGTETLFTQTYSSAILAPIPLTTVGCGPNASAASILAGPNANHPSSLSPTTNPALTTIAPTTSVHATAPVTMTATGTGFNKQSKICLNGVPQPTTFVSSTSITCTATPPAAAGSVAVTVVTGGVVVTAPQTWTIT
jgi:hypothetical protein